jgi:hypothetical protein
MSLVYLSDKEILKIMPKIIILVSDNQYEYDVNKLDKTSINRFYKFYIL